MKGFVENRLNIDWATWVSDPGIAQNIASSIVGFGYFYAFCAVLCLIVSKKNKWASFPIAIGSLSLIVLAALYYIDKGFVYAQFIEYTCQWAAPLALIWATRSDEVSKGLVNFIKIAIALTFLGHGLYALGYFPVPGNFVYMTTKILGVGDGMAKTFLKIAGVLDILIVTGIFFRKTQKPLLYYATFWGAVTALARVVAGFNSNAVGHSLSQWLHESVMRLPHGLLPLVLILFLGLSIRSKALTTDHFLKYQESEAK